MGEANNRKKFDLHYGRLPKAGLGLIISAPIEMSGSSRQFLDEFDLEDLRRCVLFWDRLAIPTGPIHYGLSPELEFLEDEGILMQPFIPHPGGQANDIVLETQARGFELLNRADPGCWAISGGANSIKVLDGRTQPDTGLNFKLINALPVPSSDVPLEEVLRFKAKRKDEISALMAEIHNIGNDVINNGAGREEVKKAISVMDSRCRDMIKVAKEGPITFKYSNLSFDLGYKLDIKNIFLGALAGYSLAPSLLLPSASALMGALAASLEIKITGGLKISRNHDFAQLKNSPFRYVSEVHTKLPLV